MAGVNPKTAVMFFFGFLVVWLFSSGATELLEKYFGIGPWAKVFIALVVFWLGWAKLS